MDFKSKRTYVELCLDYALSYSQGELSSAFSKTVSRICKRDQSDELANEKPILIQHSPFEKELSPTNIEDGLWFFFGNRSTLTWSELSFTDYYTNLKNEMLKCYVPFRSLSDESYRDMMRLRVYQDSMNIIAGRKLDGKSKRKYSMIQRTLWNLKESQIPPL